MFNHNSIVRHRLHWPTGVRIALFGLCAMLICVLTEPGFGQGIGHSFEGIRAPTGFVPPDTHGAPGPNGIIATVNLKIEYFSKSGAVIWPAVNAQTFWSSVGNSGVDNSDIQAIYDHGSRRFFLLMQENSAGHYYLNIAASKNSDPQSSGTGDWYFYRFDATESSGGVTNAAGGYNYGGDYPGFAVDSQALYCVHRMYSFNPDGSLNGCGCTWKNDQVEIMNKINLISGSGALSAVVYLGGFHQQPVTPIGSGPGNVVYVTGDWDSTHLVIYAITDPLGARSVSTQFISITDRGGGPSGGAPQSGSVNTIDPITRTFDPSYYGGDIWVCRTAGASAGPAVACYYRLRLNGWPSSGSVSVVEDSTVGDSSYWNFCPAIGVNVAGEVAMTWTRSSSSTYPTMMYAYRNASDGSFGSPAVVKASTAANNDGRWGDYAAAWPDPLDGSLWIAHEWTRSDTGTWSTWWAQVTTPAHDIYVNKNAPFPFLQIGTPQFPYTTVGSAHFNSTHGNIWIAGPNYNEFPFLFKTVNLLEWSNGVPTIGRP